ncbi:MAG: baeRF10 domain-containing protein [Burkholderiales bacterium]
MITREDLRQLAQLELPQGCAVSFYFQPQTPQNGSHKGENILAKDLVRAAERTAERCGTRGLVHSDLERIRELAENLHGNHTRAKAIFACGARDIWREFDLPPRLRSSQIFVNNRFHLRPLVAVMAASPRCCVALIDREKARLFTLWMEELVEHSGMFDALPRMGRSDGFLGFDAGHLERKYDNEARRHFKGVADRLLELQKKEDFGAIVIGCRDELWQDIESQLHVYVRQKLVGHFAIDPGVATPEQVQREAQQMLAQHELANSHELVREVLGEAQRNARGSVGLRHVLNSLERGEVQTLLLNDNFTGSAVECTNCGHLDTRIVKNCAVCGQPTRELDDVTDAIIGRSIAAGIDVVYIHDNTPLDQAGNIGALLRFRADQNTSEKLAS